MGRLNHTVSDTVASFYNGEIGNINSLKCYFEPVQAGSGTPSPDNIRPITGWTGLSATRCGKNLLNEEFFSNLDNYPIAGAYAYKYTEPIFLLPNTSYKISFTKELNYETIRYWAVKIYNDNYTDVADEGQVKYLINGTKIGLTTFTTGNKGVIRFAVYGGQDTLDDIWDNSSVQLEIGSVATAYEPYQGTTISANWASTAGTLYGGYLDLINGELVQTHAKLVCGENEDSNNWDSPHINSSLDLAYMIRETTDLSNLGLAPKQANQNNISNYCQKLIQSTAWAVRVGGTNDTKLIVMFPTDVISTKEAFLSYIAEHPLEITYELETPITYQLTPTQLSTLRAQNNIWSTANGNVEVTYDLYESGAMAAGRKMIMANQPHIKTTTSADIATFNSDMVAPLKQVKINFSPKQEGSGDPSPTNVRAISGWTSIETYTRGKNLIPSGLTTVGKYKPESGIIKTSSAYRTFYFPVPKGNIYYQAGTRGVSYACFVDEFVLGTPVYLQVTMSNRNSYNFDNSDGHKYMVIFGGSDDDFNTSVDYYTLRITTGGYTDYEAPKVGQNISIDWSSAGTVYGGYVDLTTGEIWQTWDIIDLGTLNWDKHTNSSNFYTKVISQFSQTSKLGVICNKYQTTHENVGHTPDKSISDSYQLRFRSFIINDSDYYNYTTEDFKTAMSGVIVAYPLETPQLLTTLTPNQINSFKGTNNIWGTTNGTTEVKYWSH